MTRRRTIPLAATVLVLAIGGCKVSTDSDLGIVRTESPTSFVQQDSASDQTQDEDNAAAADIDWQEVSYSGENSSGYQFNTTIKLSPYVLQSNTETAEAIWSQISGGENLPTLDDWNSIDYRYGAANRFSYTDLYYCMGTITWENVTPGWTASASNPIGVGTAVRWRSSVDDPLDDSNYNWYLKAFYANGTRTTQGDGDLKTEMFADSHSLAFIFAFPETFSPNYPDGMNKTWLINGHFEIFDGILGGDHKEIQTSIIDSNAG